MISNSQQAKTSYGFLAHQLKVILMLCVIMAREIIIVTELWICLAEIGKFILLWSALQIFRPDVSSLTTLMIFILIICQLHTSDALCWGRDISLMN
jgi:hypothetical protein